jgi:hypothetical protein
MKDYMLGPVAAMLERRGIPQPSLPQLFLRPANAYQHFRKHAPRALYRSIDSCSNCHQNIPSIRLPQFGGL